MRRFVRILLSSLRYGAVAVAAVIVIVAAGLAFLFSAPGRPILADGLETVAREVAGLDLTIGAIGPGLPTRIDVSGIELRDEQGPWLRVGEAVVSWSARALLSAAIVVDEISGTGIEVIRAPLPGPAPTEPEPEAEADEAPVGLPQVPVDVRIERIDIDAVALGPDLLGEAFRLRIAGAIAAAADSTIDATLAVDRLDGQGGGVAADVTLDPGAETLTVDVSAAEPAGGMIARALDLAPYPPVRIHLAGDGPLADWSGQLRAEIEGLTDVTLDLRHQAGEPQRLAVQGGGSIDGLLPAEVRPLVAGGIAVDLAVATDGATTVAVDTLAVTTAALAITATATIDLEQERVDARSRIATVDATRLRPLMEPARLDSLTLEARASGPLAAPAVELSVVAPSVAVPGQVAAGPVTLSMSAEPVADTAFLVAADLRAGRVEVGGVDALQPLLADGLALRVRGEAAADGSRVRLDALSLDAGPVQAAADGDVDLGADTIALRTRVTIADLAVVSGVAGLPLSGTAALGADVNGTIADLALAGTVELAVDDASLGDPVLDAVLAPSATLQADYRLEGADAVTIAPLTLTTHNLRGDGRVRLAEGMTALDAALTLVLADLAPVLAAVGTEGAGALTLEVAATEAVDDPSVSATVTTSGLAIAGNRIDDGVVTATAATVVTAPAGTLTLAAGTPYGPVRGVVDGALTDGETFRISRLELSGAGLDLNGSLATVLAAGTIDGNLRGRWRPGRDGYVFGEQRIRGRADLAIDLAAPAGRQRLTADVRVDDLAVAAVGGAQTARIDSLTLTAAADDALGQPVLSADLAAAGITAGGRSIDRVEAGIDGSLDLAPFKLAIVGGDGVPASVRMGGTLAATGDPVIGLNALEGDLAGQPLALQRPATITLGEVLDIAGLALTIGDGSVAIDGRLAPAGPTATVRIDSLPLALAEAAAPDVAFGGSIDAAVDLAPAGGLLAGTLSFSVNDLEMARRGIGLSTVPPLTVRADARLAGGRLDADLRVVDIGGDDLVVRADVPAAISATTFAPRDPGDAPLSASVRWEGELEPLVAAVPVDVVRMSGPGRINLDVAGSLDAPQITGDITTDQARLEVLASGTEIENLAVALGLDANRDLTARVSGTDGEDGTVVVEADVGLGHDDAPLTIEATVESRNAVLVRRDDVIATVDADISFRDAEADKRLEGRIEARHVEVRLVNQMPPSVVELDVVEIDRDGNRVGEAAEDPAQAADPIRLDLTVNIPARLFVRGRGLDSEWKGDLTVGGTSAKPDIQGEIQLVRGNLTLIGRRFDLTEGTVTLRGGGDVDPELAIVAENTVQGVTGRIRISGNASEPELEMTASDGRPESEVLPLLLFGKRSDELGASEALQLALALDTLRGGTSDDAGFAAREALGLDVLSVESGAEGGNDAAVRAGTYLNENIYVETRQGTKPGTSKYRAEVRITDRIAVETEFGPGEDKTSGSIGLKWELEY